MVSVSPRLLDDLDTDDDEIISSDPRFSYGFSSLTLSSASSATLETSYSDLEVDVENDTRAFAGTPDPGSARRRRRQRHSDVVLEKAEPHQYETIIDSDIFRLAVIQPGAGQSIIEVSLLWETSKQPARSYCCLSYAWESVTRDKAILLDGKRFPVTRNLLKALEAMRKPRTTLLIWIDQICINQSDFQERAHQVSIMKYIFNQARKIYVWLGEADNRSEKLFEYATKLRRGDDSPRSVLNRTLGPRELKQAIQDLLERPWFQRVWVIPEVALSRQTTVVCGRSHITWDTLVRLFRDVQLPANPGFDKHTSLLGNPRQRIAIITQMASSQKEGKAHTDVTQLLILAKSSRATDVRDMVYAYYGLTHCTTYPSYKRDIAELYMEICSMYIYSILEDTAYASWHGLDEKRRTFQLLSILYSSGLLQQSQNFALPSWVPDWTFSWHLAPIWIKTLPNFITARPKDDWTAGIRSAYRAGGNKLETFHIREGSRHQLKLSAVVLDSILLVNEVTPASTPASTPGLPDHDTSKMYSDSWDDNDLSILRYGRHFFTSAQGYVGLADPRILPGDKLAILLGGDVPVVLRPVDYEGKSKAYQLLCECWIQSSEIMKGDFLRENWVLAEDIVLL